MGRVLVNGIQPRQMYGDSSHKQNKGSSALLQNAWYLFTKCCSRGVVWRDTT